MTFFWNIKVFDDLADEDAPAVRQVKGTGSLDDLTKGVARMAMELDESEVLDISVDPIPGAAA